MTVGNFLWILLIWGGFIVAVIAIFCPGCFASLSQVDEYNERHGCLTIIVLFLSVALSFYFLGELASSAIALLGLFFIRIFLPKIALSRVSGKSGMRKVWARLREDYGSRGIKIPSLAHKASGLGYLDGQAVEVTVWVSKKVLGVVAVAFLGDSQLKIPWKDIESIKVLPMDDSNAESFDTTACLCLRGEQEHTLLAPWNDTMSVFANAVVDKLDLPTATLVDEEEVESNSYEGRWRQAVETWKHGNNEGALFAMRRLAAEGTEYATVAVGTLLEIRGEEEDIDEAIKYYRRAIFEYDDLIAHMGLGRIMMGRGDYNTAKKHFERAAVKERGANFALGVLYERSAKAEASDLKKAMLYYVKAANDGHLLAQRNLALCLLKTSGSRFKGAKELFLALKKIVQSGATSTDDPRFTIS